MVDLKNEVHHGVCQLCHTRGDVHRVVLLSDMTVIGCSDEAACRQRWWARMKERGRQLVEHESRAHGLKVLRGLRAALQTTEGRALAKEVLGLFRAAADEVS